MLAGLCIGQHVSMGKKTQTDANCVAAGKSHCREDGCRVCAEGMHGITVARPWEKDGKGSLVSSTTRRHAHFVIIHSPLKFF